MNALTRRRVRQRARDCCEYCRLHQDYEPYYRFHVEHLTAQQHGGSDRLNNLALVRHRCNSFKGPNIAGFGPRTAKLTLLFHPRRHAWRRHFDWDGAHLTGRTAVGRTTINVLLINLDLRVEHRQALLDAGFSFAND